MTLEVLCTAVSERADLFIETMESMLSIGKIEPSRLIVHEDVRPGSDGGPIAAWLRGCGIPYEHKATVPSRGLGPALLWCFQKATQPIVFYTQEDWRFVREVPVRRCMDLMERHGLNHVRFNKRKTMRAKHADTQHPWHKVEVEFPDGDGAPQKMCISDHFYTQASLHRVSTVLPAIVATAEKAPQANAFVAAFNHHLNMKHIGNPAMVQDQQTRHAKLKTYIWGSVGEPRFIEHIGTTRTTGPIDHTAKGRR